MDDRMAEPKPVPELPADFWALHERLTGDWLTGAEAGANWKRDERTLRQRLADLRVTNLEYEAAIKKHYRATLGGDDDE